MAHDLFISYSTKDKTTADAVCARMESGGVRCWYAPRDIEPGADWAESIIKAIDDSKVMALIFTKDSNVSRQVLREVNYAVGAGVTIIPLRLTAEEPIERMRYYLSAVHWIDALDSELDEKIEELYETCKAVIDTKPTDVVPLDERKAVAAPKKRKGLLIGLAIVGALIALAAVMVGKAVSGINAVEEQLIAEPDGKGGMSSIGTKDDTSEETNEGATEETSEASGATGTSEASEALPDFPIGSLSENAGKDLPTASVGNTITNLTNGGFMTYSDGWYYFRSNDSGKLYKMREDGSDAKKLSDHEADNISVYDGYVYFNTDAEGETGIYRVDLNGENEELMWYNNASFLFIKDNKMYWSDYTKVNALDLALVDDEFSCDFITGEEVLVGEFPDDGWPYGICYAEDKIYYIDIDKSNLYRANYDATDIELLYDHNLSDLTIAGNLVFFYDFDDEMTKCYDIGKGEVVDVTREILSYMNITGDGIYAVDASDALVLYDPTTGEKKTLYDKHSVTQPCLAGNKINYSCLHKRFAADLDGKNRVQL